MRIMIIGAGAIGLMIGSYLRRAEAEVTFVTRTMKQARLIQHEGIQGQSSTGELFATSAQAIAAEEQPKTEHVDLVIVCVKQTAIKSVMQWIAMHMDKQTPILFIMNGLGHQELAAQHLTDHPLMFGITQMGVTKTSGHSFLEKGAGRTKIGAIESIGQRIQHQNNPTMIKNLLSICAKTKFQIEWVEQIEIEMVKKCIINACINPLTAIFAIKNGDLIKNQHLQQLMKNGYHELKNLLYNTDRELATTLFHRDHLWQEIVQVCRITSENLSSMVQDMKHERLTENEAISGYFIKKAEKHAVPVPFHRFLYLAIKYKESEYNKT